MPSLDLSMFPGVVLELGARFRDAGHDLCLVGGPVRDALLGRPSPDLDFTTDARPDAILEAVEGWADATWDVGRDFGTIALRKDGHDLEVTTYRAEAYDASSRKPAVRFGDRLEDDLVRRDFTVNAMALRLPSGELVDVCGGVLDLHNGLLRTPGAPEDSFSDDPLRMMRAARFVSQLGLGVAGEVREAMAAMAGRLDIVSAERVRDEVVKLMLGAAPRPGIELLADTGLLERVLPEVAALRLEIDEHHRHKDIFGHTLTVVDQAIDLETGPDGPVPGPDFVLRFAALMHDVGKPPTRRFEPGGAVSFHHHDVVGAKMTRRRMRELRFDKETIKAVTRLVELHLRFYGYADAGWSDSAVRRYVTDAGEQLERLHRLTRADVTTRNRRKAERLEFAYDDLERRVAELREKEELAAIRPALDGRQIMELLGVSPGPAVGRAYKFLMALRMEEGPMEPGEAAERLRAWWADNLPAQDSGSAAPSDAEGARP